MNEKLQQIKSAMIDMRNSLQNGRERGNVASNRSALLEDASNTVDSAHVQEEAEKITQDAALAALSCSSALAKIPSILAWIERVQEQLDDMEARLA